MHYKLYIIFLISLSCPENCASEESPCQEILKIEKRNTESNIRRVINWFKLDNNCPCKKMPLECNKLHTVHESASNDLISYSSRIKLLFWRATYKFQELWDLCGFTYNNGVKFDVGFGACFYESKSLSSRIFIRSYYSDCIVWSNDYRIAMSYSFDIDIGTAEIHRKSWLSSIYLGGGGANKNFQNIVAFADPKDKITLIGIGFTKGIGRFNISDYSLMLSLLYNLKRYGDGYSIMFSAGVGCTFNIFKIQRQNDSQESLNKFKDSMISKLYITSNSIFRGLFIEELDKMISIGPVCKLDVGAKYFNQSVEISAGHSFRTYTDIKSKIFEIKNPDQKLSEVKNILDTTTNSLYYKGSTGIRIKYVAYIKGECISIFIFSEIEAKSLGGLTLKEGNSYIPKLTLSSGVFPDIKPSGNTGAYDNIYLHFLKYSIRSSVKTKLGIGCSLYV